MVNADLQQSALDSAQQTVQGIADKLRQIADKVEQNADTQVISRDPNFVLFAVTNDVLWGVANAGVGNLAKAMSRLYQARVDQ